MKKDYDYEDYEAYMRSLYQYLEDLAFEQEVRVAKIMREQDDLEVAVATRPCYNSAEKLMNAVREM